MSLQVQTEITEDEEEDIVILSPQDDQDFLRCMQYLEWREAHHKKKLVDIALLFDVHRNTLRAWIIKWDNSGLLRRCRQVLFSPRVEEISSAVDMLVDDWPEVLSRQLGGCLTSVPRSATCWWGYKFHSDSSSSPDDSIFCANSSSDGSVYNITVFRSL